MKSFLEIIEDQLVVNRLPLAGITITATPYANTPVVVNLHWHAFVEVKLAAEGNAVAHQPVPTSALQVNSLWERFQDLENEALETAWELGASDLSRIESRPCGRPAAGIQERLDCMTAFGVSPIEINGEPVVVSVRSSSPIPASVPTSSSTPLRRSGSPPVMRTFSTPWE